MSFLDFKAKNLPADLASGGVSGLIAIPDAIASAVLAGVNPTYAFNALMTAFGLPRNTDDEADARRRAIQTATLQAIEVPLRVMEVSLASMEVTAAMAATGNPASVSDAGVAALCARSAVLGAYLNVRINAVDLDDRAAATEYLRAGLEIQESAMIREQEILDLVEERL